jgi:foldase protein PrsA
MSPAISGRRLAVAASALALIVLPACGGSSGSSNGVPSGSVAKCGDEDITQSQLSDLLDRAKTSYTAQKRTFPKPGSAEYAQLQQQAVTQLVQQCEIKVGADRLGISVSDSDVEKRLDQIKKQYFPTKDGKGVDDKKYQAALKKQGLTEDALKAQVHEQLLEQKAYDKLTKSVSATSADIKKYYNDNKKTLYTQGPTRHVRHILVKKKALADKLYKQLVGSDKQFGALAKKYSTDKTSAVKGGDLGDITQGQTVAEFNKTAFEIAQGIVSRPVKTQFGYHLIEALGPVKPASVKPLDSTLEAQIKAQLLQTKKQKAFYDWYQKLKKELDAKVKYAKGYAPPSTATTATTSTT